MATTRSLDNFFNNPFLSDITLTNPATEQTYHAHKLLLASASDLFHSVFQKVDPHTLPSLVVPRWTATKYPLIEDPFPKVMAYIYSNQNFEHIKEELTE